MNFRIRQKEREHQSDRIASREFTLHIANPGSIPQILYGPQACQEECLSSDPGVTFEHCWVWLENK